MTDALLALAMCAALLLIVVGGWALVRGQGSRVKAGLMVAAGLVTIFNVWVNTAKF